MSQIEQNIRQFLSKRPEIEKCVQENLINRRSLARYLIKHRIAESHQLEAVIGTLRRYKFNKYSDEEKDLFKKIKIRIKDNILIYDFLKEKKLLHELKNVIDNIQYDQGDTFKVVVGSSSVKIFVDEDKKDIVKKVLNKFTISYTLTNVSEMSIIFPSKAIDTKGVISYITRELYNHDIIISELLTASPELLIYLKEEYILKAYELVKRIKK